MLQLISVRLIGANIDNIYDFSDIKYVQFIDKKGPGSFGVLKQHMPYCTLIKTGMIIIQDKDDKRARFNLNNFLISVIEDRIEILADRIEKLSP